MPDYKETDVTGKTWQRAVRVQIDNPYGALPSLMFVEEQVTKTDTDTITKLVANLSCVYDANSQLHVDIYTKLNELYVLLREARDNG